MSNNTSTGNGFYIETIHPAYHGKDPVFFDKSAFGWALDLESFYPQIKEELAPLLSNDFSDFSVNPEAHIQFPPRLWKQFVFYFNGIKFNRHLERFPLTANVLAGIPHLVNANISVLEPGAHILPHSGNTNAVVRAHLPLVVPASKPACSMTIAGKEISWIEGEILLFCDMHLHSTRNDTHKRRYVLMVDVMRPEYIPLKKEVCTHITSAILTNIVRNFYKKIFQIPFTNFNPSKKFQPESSADLYGTTAPPAQTYSGLHPIKIAEKVTASILLFASRIYYSFVKLQ